MTEVATPTKQRRAALETPVKATAQASKTAGFVLPKSLAVCADMAYTLRQDRYALQKQIDEMQKKETALTEHLINNLPKSDASGVRGKVAWATIKDKEVVELVGTEQDRFSKVYDYILKNGRKDPGVWSLLQRRVGDAAAKELIAAGKGALIGAKLGTVPTVSLTKV